MENVANSIQIPLSKTKIVLLTIGSLVLVCLGIWFILGFATLQNRISPLLIRLIGVVAVLFFGGTFAFSIHKYFDSGPGLIINQNGIIDNTSGVSIGLIDWESITGIRSKQIMSTQLLLIDTNDPEKFVAKASGIKAKIMRTNYNMYGTPLSITATTLKYDAAELEELLKSALLKNKGF